MSYSLHPSTISEHNNDIFCYPSLFSSLQEMREVCSLLCRCWPRLGWCGPSLAGWPAPGQPSWLSVLPGPPQSAHHTQIERHSSDQWQWLQLQRSFRGGYSGDRTCKWYKPSLSRVDTMSNRLTRLIIMSVVCSVVSYPIIFHIDTIKSLTVKKANPIFDK